MTTFDRFTIKVVGIAGLCGAAIALSPGAAAAPPIKTGGAWVKPAHTPFWKRAIFSLLWLPDDRQGFILPAIRAARPLLARSNSVLYTSAPPFSTLLAGWWLRRGRGVRWVVEFRDPWAGNPWKPAHVRSAFTDSAERMMERRVLTRADLIVAVSEGIERGIRDRRPDLASRLLTIRNGIDQLSAAPAEQSNGPVRIVHVGSFYHGRDPRPFLHGLAAVTQANGWGPEHVRVDLVGKCRWYQGSSIEQEVDTLGLRDVVHFHDWVPHAEAQAFVHSADALLLLAQNQPDQVPNKLYEYLGVRRTILAFLDEEGESSRMLRRVGGHLLLTGQDARATEEALVRLISRQPPDQLPNAAVLQEWTAGTQMQHLVRRTGEIVR